MEKGRLHVGGSQCHEQIIPEMHRCWGGKASLVSYREHLSEIDTHPWARCGIRNLTLEDSDGNCLSSLCLHTVGARHNGTKVRLGGIARVITPARLRGQGLAGGLVRATLELLAQEGFDRSTFLLMRSRSRARSEMSAPWPIPTGRPSGRSTLMPLNASRSGS
jgi:hypothetical protein